MMTPDELKCLRKLIAREEAAANPAEQLQPEPVDIGAGDVVQLRPLTCPTFGGMLLQVCQAEPYFIRGFLLRPHRGGCREAWLKLKYSDVERIGRASWPDAEFGRRCEARGPKCRVAR